MSNTRKIKRMPGTTYRTIGKQRIPVVPQDPHIQAVIDDDAQFFNAHPDVWERLRPWVPGELQDGREDAPARWLVRVIRLERENKVPKHPNDGPMRVRVRGDVPVWTGSVHVSGSWEDIARTLNLVICPNIASVCMVDTGPFSA